MPFNLGIWLIIRGRIYFNSGHVLYPNGFVGRWGYEYSFRKESKTQ